MGKQELERHTQWRVEQEKRFDLYLMENPLYICFSAITLVTSFLVIRHFFLFRMVNFQVTRVSFRELLDKYLIS